MLEQIEIEKIAPEAIVAMKTTARQKTWDAVHAIRNLVKPSMTEKEAIKKANEYLASVGVKKFWHKTHIRFGESTILSFDDPYYDNVTLKDDDIFYVDIGPIWDGIEGDCGETFVIGNNPEFIKITQDVKNLFHEVHNYWRQNENASGLKLQEFSKKITEKMGYLMFPTYVKGHRISEFSHAKYTSTVGTFDTEFKPSADRWILEFQICHSSMKFGAFYEDLLT